MVQINTLKGYENVKPVYFVTEEGDIYSFSDCNYGFKEEPHKLNPKLTRWGYYETTLVCKDQSFQYVRLHRVVAAAYHLNPNNYKVVHHKNGIKTDNRAENLEWINPREHSRISNSKPLFMYNRDGELEKKYQYATQSVDDGFNLSHVGNVARGIEKTHRGKYFSYVPLTKEEVLQRLSKPYPHLYGDGRRK